MNTGIFNGLFRSVAAAAVAAVAVATMAMAQLCSAASPSAYRLELEFVDDHLSKRALAEWQGRPVVIAMAYGACRSICSTTLRTLEAIQARADRINQPIEILVVSIDPHDDTPQAWADYRKAHRLTRSNWTFLSGSVPATRKLGQFLGIRFWSYDEHVMHDFKIVRLGADGGVQAVLDWDHREPDLLFQH